MLWVIISISFSAELWVHQFGNSNMPFYHVYILVEYLFLLKIFSLLFDNYIGSKVWILISIGFILTWIGNLVFIQDWYTFPDYIHALEAIIILILIALWFVKMLKEKIIKRPERTFEFWMCSGLFLFFSGNFLLFLFSKFLMTIDMVSYDAIWIIHTILNLILYIMYTIAILWVKKTTKLY